MVINGALPNSLRKIVECEVRGCATKWNRGHKIQITERLKAKQSNKLHCDKEGRRDRGRRDGQGSAELPTHEHYAARVTERRTAGDPHLALCVTAGCRQRVERWGCGTNHFPVVFDLNIQGDTGHKLITASAPLGSDAAGGSLVAVISILVKD